MRFRSAVLMAVLVAVVAALSVVVPVAPAIAAPPRGPDVERLCGQLEQTPARVPLCTHGPDPVRALGGVAALATPPPLASPATLAGLCHDGGVSGKRIEVLYGVPQDRVSRYDEMLPVMRRVLAETDANLDASDPGTSQHYRWVCANGTDVTVRNVVLLPVGSDQSFTFSDYVSSLQNQVALGLGPVSFVDPNRVYLGFVDEITDVYPYGGQGNLYWSDNPDPAVNPNNSGYVRYAMSAYFSVRVVGHEIGHTLGAVQRTAPHSSGAGHCHDHSDLMCYNDGGSYFTGGGQLTYPCGVQYPAIRVDCGHDDYYFPGSPPPGHYLASHWNTANSGYLTQLVDHAPTLTARTPESGAAGQSATASVTAVFDQPVLGVDAATFTLSDGDGAQISATVGYDAETRVATLDPTADLAADTSYTATLLGGPAAIRDRDGNALDSLSWSFTTGPAPTAVGAPVAGTRAVAARSNVTATFDEPVLGVDGATFTLAGPGGTPVPATVTYDEATRTATLDPTGDLAADIAYTATLVGGPAAIRDVVGNPLASPSWVFTTGPAPTVTGTAPAGGATAVGVATDVTVTFGEAVRSVDSGTFTLRTADGTPVPATVSYNSPTRVATLNPAADLLPDRRYTVTVTGGTGAVRDLAGNPLATRAWTFTTGPAPTLTAARPAARATAVPIGANVTATFSEPVAGVDGTRFTLRTAAGVVVPATVRYDATTRVATLDPRADLAPDRQYTVTLTGGSSAVRDLAGNPLATRTWTFTTGPAPTVASRTPASGATAVGRTANVTATLSEAAQGVTRSTFTLRNTATGALVTAVVSRNGTTNQWVLNPSATLPARTQFTVTLTGGTSAIRDLAGNPLRTTAWTFTTGG